MPPLLMGLEIFVGRGRRIYQIDCGTPVLDLLPRLLGCAFEDTVRFQTVHRARRAESQVAMHESGRILRAGDGTWAWELRRGGRRVSWLSI